jgi:hypothetical protein
MGGHQLRQSSPGKPESAWMLGFRELTDYSENTISGMFLN